MSAKTNKEKGKPPNTRKKKSGSKPKSVNANHKPRKKWTDKERELAIARYIETGNCYKTAGELEIPESTVRGWIKEAFSANDQLAKLREAQRAAMCTRAWEIIQMGTSVIEKRLRVADENQDELLALIKEIFSAKDMEFDEKMELVKKIGAIAMPNIKDISGIVTAMYDKQAHADTGIDPSKNSLNVNITIEE